MDKFFITPFSRSSIKFFKLLFDQGSFYVDLSFFMVFPALKQTKQLDYPVIDISHYFGNEHKRAN